MTRPSTSPHRLALASVALGAWLLSCGTSSRPAGEPARPDSDLLPSARLDAGATDARTPPTDVALDEPARAVPDGSGKEGPATPGSDASSDRAAAASGDGAGPRDSQAEETGPVASGCATGVYPLCVDFEGGKIPADWTMKGTPGEVTTVKAAHGRYAFHIPASMNPTVQLETTKLGVLKNVVWARFYLIMAPGSPTGHGAIFNAWDQKANWYEVGSEYNSFFGNWHVASNWANERIMRSAVKVSGEAWNCVEAEFDGAKPDVARIWVDGQPVAYVKPASTPGPEPVERFVKLQIGWQPFHGSSLTSYEGKTPPILTDVWIDDVAVDSKRVGCLP